MTSLMLSKTNFPRRIGKTVLTIQRRDVGTKVKGRYVEATPYEVEVVANVQPITRLTDRMLLPEADRSSKALVIYSQTPLRAMREGDGGWEADRFVWTDGDEYEIKSVTNYEMGVLNHFRAVAIRMELTR